LWVSDATAPGTKFCAEWVDALCDTNGHKDAMKKLVVSLGQHLDKQYTNAVALEQRIAELEGSRGPIQAGADPLKQAALVFAAAVVKELGEDFEGDIEVYREIKESYERLKALL
jgi:predicted nucleic acid-binding protein